MPSPDIFRPHMVTYDATLRTSTILDRRYRPILKVRGRYPLVDWNSAVECPDDAPPVTAGGDAIRIYFEDAGRREIDLRLKPLFAKCELLRTIVNRRINGASQPRPVPVQTLAERTFRPAPLTYNVIGEAS